MKRVLWDECVPRIRGWRPQRFSVVTVQKMGWSAVKNGELLKLAEVDFDVLVTADKNLRYQQNMKDRRIAIVELPCNDLPSVIRLLPRIEVCIDEIQSGEYVVIEPA